MQTNLKCVIAVVVFVLGAVCSISVFAADRSWRGEISSDGLVAENWNPKSIPTKETSIAVGESATPVEMRISGNDVVFEFNGGDFGNQGFGHLVAISDGAKVLSYDSLAIGNWASDCVTTVDGVETELAVMPGARLYAGGAGSRNTLLFRNGAIGHFPTGQWAYLFVGNGGSNNKLQIDGAGTAFYASDTRVGNGGSTNTLVVSDGGVFYATNSVLIGNNTGKGNEIFVKDGIFEAVKPNGGRVDINANNGSRFVFSGSAARGLIGGFTAKKASSMEILDGAVVTNYAQMSFSHDGTVGVDGGCWLVVSNATLNAGYNINAGNFVDNSKILVLDGGKIYNPSYFFDIGSFATAHGNEMVIDGEGSFVSCARWRIGGQGYCNRGIVRNGGELSTPAVHISSGNTVNCISNGISVLDGGKITLTGWNGSVQSYVNTSNSFVQINDGIIASTGSDNEIKLYNRSVLRLGGTKTSVNVARIKLYGESEIEFEPPVDAQPVYTPYVTVRRGASCDDDNDHVVLRIINAEYCMRKGGGLFTLISSPNESIAEFKFARVVAPSGVRIIRDENSIKVKIPNMGMKIFVR